MKVSSSSEPKIGDHRQVGGDLSGQLSNRVTFNGPTQSSFPKHGTRWMCVMTQLIWTHCYDDLINRNDALHGHNPRTGSHIRIRPIRNTSRLEFTPPLFSRRRDLFSRSKKFPPPEKLTDDLEFTPLSSHPPPSHPPPATCPNGSAHRLRLISAYRLIPSILLAGFTPTFLFWLFVQHF
jgi:hypothetical protein